MTKIIVEGSEINVTKVDEKDYISLTDMIKANYGEFAIIKSQSGLNSEVVNNK